MRGRSASAGQAGYIKFDVVVIGAGPAGLTTAYKLASAGFKTLVVERGRKPGSKQVYGGRIYAYYLDKVIPEFRKEAPVERWVKKERVTFLTEEDATTLEVESNRFNGESFVANLSSFTEWLGKKAESVGAVIITEAVVDSLVVKDGRVVGVRSGEDVVLADVVVIAEGTNRLVLERSGLAPKLEPRHVALGIKEAIKLGEDVIEERFGLHEDEGMAWMFVGLPTKYLPGGGFIYTGKDYISLGVVIYLRQGLDLPVPSHETVEDFKMHQFVARLVKGGTLLEYSAHLTPVTGLEFSPSSLYGDGWLVVGDAAGLLLHAGVLIRGVDMAIMSGALAAEAIMRAPTGKYDSESLRKYVELLDSTLFRELRAYREADAALSNPRIYRDYVKFVNDLLKDYFTVDGEPRRVYPTFMKTLKRDGIRLGTLMRDLVKALKGL